MRQPFSLFVFVIFISCIPWVFDWIFAIRNSIVLIVARSVVGVVARHQAIVFIVVEIAFILVVSVIPLINVVRRVHILIVDVIFVISIEVAISINVVISIDVVVWRWRILIVIV
jgi:hypothetical protein